MKATFITLALDDGADPNIIRERVTHTKHDRSAFAGYVRTSDPKWTETCREVARRSVGGKVIALPVAKVAGTRVASEGFAASLATVVDSSSENVVEAAGVES